MIEQALADSYPAARLARICRRLGADPATQLGAETKGLSHPFSRTEWLLRDLLGTTSRGFVTSHWTQPEMKGKSTAQMASEWNDNYARFKAKNAKGAPDAR